MSLENVIYAIRTQALIEANECLHRALTLLGASDQQIQRIWPVLVMEFPGLGEPGVRNQTAPRQGGIASSAPAASDMYEQEVSTIDIEVVNVNILSLPNSSLKALVEFNLVFQFGTMGFKDFKVIQQGGQEAWVSVTQAEWYDKAELDEAGNPKKKWKNLVKFPDDLKQRVDAAILAAYREKGTIAY